MSFQYVNEHREYLKKEFETRLRRRPLYSQRAFARDIGLSPSALTDYFKGRIRLSAGRIAQVSKTIGLTPEQKQHWIDLIEMKHAKTAEEKQVSQLRVKARIESQSHSISVDQFKIISEWFHLAYIELIQMDPQKYSVLKTAALALGIPARSMKVAAQRLEDVGLLRKDAEGIYSVNAATRLGDGVPSMAVRQFHAQVLKKAAASLEGQTMDRRFVSTTMVALPKAEVDKILMDLKTLAVRYLDPYIQPQPRPVGKDYLYCLTIQFFDLLSQKEPTL